MRLRCDLIRSLSRNSLSRILLTTATCSCPHLCPSSLRRCVSWLTDWLADFHDSENQEGEGAVQAEWPPECPGPVWQWPGQWAWPGGGGGPGGQHQGPHALQHQPRQHQDVALTQLRVHGWHGEPRVLQGRCHPSPLTRHWPRVCPQARKPKYQKKEPRKTRKRSSPQRPVLPDLCQPPPQRIPVVSRPVTKRSVRMPGVWPMIKMISGIPSPTSPSSFHYLKNSSIFLRSTTQAPRCPRSTPARLKMNPSPPTLSGLTPSVWPPSSSASSRRLSSPRPRRRPLTPLLTRATLTRAGAGARGTRQPESGRSFLVSVNTTGENQQ